MTCKKALFSLLAIPLIALTPLYAIQFDDDEDDEDWEDEFEELLSLDDEEEERAIPAPPPLLVKNERMTQSEKLDYQMRQQREERRNCWPPDDKQIVVSAEFLYWKIDEAFLDYAISRESFAHPQWFGCLLSDLVGDFQFGTYEYRPGYRGDIAYMFKTTPWVIDLEYTWFETEHSNHSKRPNNNSIQTVSSCNSTICSLAPPSGQLAVTHELDLSNTTMKASSHLHFFYNVADLTLQRDLHLVKHFTLTPFFGARGAVIHQKWKLTADTVSAAGNCSGFNLHSQAVEKWRFNGGGIVAGVVANFCLGWGFSLFGTANASALHGTYHHGLSSKSIPSSVEHVSRFSNEEDRTITASQLSAGIELSHNWKGLGIRLFGGWEFNCWTNLQETYRSVVNEDPNVNPKIPIIDSSNVYIQGAVGGIELRF